MNLGSIRGQAPALNFEEVLLTGLAADGGLYIPESLPRFSADEIASMASMDYPQLAQKIITPFVDDCIAADDGHYKSALGACKPKPKRGSVTS